MAPNSFERLKSSLMLHSVEIGARSTFGRRKVEQGRAWAPESGSVGPGSRATGLGALSRTVGETLTPVSRHQQQPSGVLAQLTSKPVSQCPQRSQRVWE